MATSPELLPDDVWALVSPILREEDCASIANGRPRVSARRCFGALLWIAWHGAVWKELPPSFGSRVTVWRRMREWRRAEHLEPAVRSYHAATRRSAPIARWNAARCAVLSRRGGVLK